MNFMDVQSTSYLRLKEGSSNKKALSLFSIDVQNLKRELHMSQISKIWNFVQFFETVGSLEIQILYNHI